MKKRLSYSALTNFAKSPNHLLKYWSKKFEPTAAMMLGSLIHKIILEPDTFDHDYAVFEGTRRGKVWESFKAEHSEKELVTLKEYDIANYVVNETKSNDIFMDLLMRTSETEKEIRWTCKGIEFKGFVDMIGDTFIADIKTTTDAGDKFQRDLLYNDYKMQAAMYLEAFPGKDFYIIAVEKSGAFNVQVYKFSQNLLKEGRFKYLNLVDKYKNWNGEKGSYYNGIIEI